MSSVRVRVLILAVLSVAVAAAAPRGRAALPPCAVGAISVAAAPSLSAPSPAFTGSTVTSSSGAFTSCASAVTGFYKEWLRNGAVVSGPTWTTGGGFGYTIGAADVGATLRSGVQPCNADGCYGSYVLSSNAVVPANRSPGVPSGLTPADGTSADSRTPTLAATFTDPDGQSGRVTFTVRRSLDGVVVASGGGSTVGSGGISKWTVPSGKLTPGGKYRWTAAAVDASGSGSASSAANWYGANPVWLYSSCATDGSASATSPSCTSTQDLVEDGPSPDTCTGTDGFCDAADDDIAAAGASTLAVGAASASELDTSVADGGSPASTGFTGRWAWLIFELTRAVNGTCGANPVVDNGYCGSLWHSWMQYTNGQLTPGTTTHSSRFFARSGDNDPLDKWVRNLGALPDTWDHSASPAGELAHHWGWNNGHFQGYVRLSDPKYYPGAWSIDPYVVFHDNPGQGESASRNAFMIHGGWQGHEYEASRTLGCIRLRYKAIAALKAKWDNATGNKKIPFGPRLYIYYAS